MVDARGLVMRILGHVLATREITHHLVGVLRVGEMVGQIY